MERRIGNTFLHSDRQGFGTVMREGEVKDAASLSLSLSLSLKDLEQEK